MYSRDEVEMSSNLMHASARSKLPAGGENNTEDGPPYSSFARPKFNTIAWIERQSYTCKCLSVLERWDICNLVSIPQPVIPRNSKTLQLDSKRWRSPSVIFVSARKIRLRFRKPLKSAGISRETEQSFIYCKCKLLLSSSRSRKSILYGCCTLCYVVERSKISCLALEAMANLSHPSMWCPCSSSHGAWNWMLWTPAPLCCCRTASTLWINTCFHGLSWSGLTVRGSGNIDLRLNSRFEWRRQRCFHGSDSMLVRTASFRGNRDRMRWQVAELKPLCVSFHHCPLQMQVLIWLVFF